MLCNELIIQLTEIQKKHGDIVVYKKDDRGAIMISSRDDDWFEDIDAVTFDEDGVGNKSILLE